MKLRTIMKNFLIFMSVTMSTSASALVQYNPNSIYMIGASVNAQLYNEEELVDTAKFGPNADVINKDNPLYFSGTFDNKDKIFWGQIPNNHDLYYLPPPDGSDSNVTSMMAGYYAKVPGSPFAPLIPAHVLVGWVGTMCQPVGEKEDEGLKAIKYQINELILNAHSLTKIVLMKYPTEGIDFSNVSYCEVNNVRGDYFANASNYNAYIETLRLWYASVYVIDPWESYTTTTKYPADPVHADDSTLENAAIRIRECFENGLPLSCSNTP